jgi:predicted AAA+ superfamily ATPase
MDATLNPFAPGAGAPPKALIGRDDILENVRVAFVRIFNGLPAKSPLLYGLRGVGKTVLLNKIEEIGINQGFRTIHIEAHESKSLAALLIPRLRGVLLQLDRGEKVNALAMRGLRILRSWAL